MADKGARIIVITKKAKGHAHHGGAWKVAYADFVTAMMALFMVLWLLAQTDQGTKQKLSEYFRTGIFQGAPSVLMGGTGLMEGGYLDVNTSIMKLDAQSLHYGADSINQALEAAGKESTGALETVIKNVDIQLTDQGLLIQILDGGDDLLFERSSSDLKPKLKQLLAVIAPILGKLKNQIQVHGHTDARPFPLGAGRTNWDLSYERANAARRELEENGLTPGQITGVFAHGSSSPYVKSDPFSSKNRRLAIMALRRGAEEPTSRGKPTQPAPITGKRPFQIRLSRPGEVPPAN